MVHNQSIFNLGLYLMSLNRNIDFIVLFSNAKELIHVSNAIIMLLFIIKN
jgi:hypothetical protein